MKKVLTGMSGGVDSSVTAHLLMEKGYSVAGANLVMHSNDRENSCGCRKEVEIARKVCKSIGIDFYSFDFTEEFEKNVIKDFIDTYTRGATPNPCVVCNRNVKFEGLIKKAGELGFDFVATGHYARIEEDRGRFLLRRGVDQTKDQSYVLYCLTQAQLSATLFPLGEYSKDRVRKIAADMGLINAHRRESQDICFIPDGKYFEFIEERLGRSFDDGDFVTLDGRVLGTHKGIIRYTIGQRKGLGLALPAPMYVYGKDMEANRVILTDEAQLFSSSLTANKINLIPFDKLSSPMRVKAKARYRQQEQPAIIEQLDENRIHVEFDSPQRAIAKGQSVVFYEDDYVIGGGVIE